MVRRSRRQRCACLSYQFASASARTRLKWSAPSGAPADANIYREPERFGYPVINAGVVRAPQFGYIFLEKRPASQRRPKLVDGLDWVPSSAANASTRLLQDGVTELVRYYCARRTKADVARPHAKPYVIFQRSVYNTIKASSPRATTYDIKVLPTPTLWAKP